MPSPLATRYLPGWLRSYQRHLLPQDLLAGLVVAAMLVPQAMAYALLAGLPPQLGLYASILPLIAYACLGTSMTLAVGPMAVTSLMTAAVLTPLAAPGSADYVAGAAMLALLSGAVLLLCGLLRFGFIATLLSNPVISGFMSGASLLIAISQLKPLLGLPGGGGTALSMLIDLSGNLSSLHVPTALVGVGALLLFALSGRYLAPFAQRLGLSPTAAGWLPKLMPMLAAVIAMIVADRTGLAQRYGIAAIGALPAGLPELRLPLVDADFFRALLLPACLLGLINFVGSVAVAQALAVRRKQRIDADAELRALGAANIASALSGALPVSGGFARSLANFAAGAQTPLAGVVAAVCLAIVVSGFADAFGALPLSLLAAIIIAAVVPAIDFAALRRIWSYDRADALALAGTAAGVVLAGVEAGIATGVGLSLASLVWRSGHPHIAVIGRVPFTEHFRNVLRHKVETLPQLLALRIDENLLFANAQAVDERIRIELERHPAAAHVLLVLSSVNQIDATGLEMLLELNAALRLRGIELHLAEVKGPVLDRLQQSTLPGQLSGRIFLSTHQAFVALGGGADDYTI